MHAQLLVHDVLIHDPRATRSTLTNGEWSVSQQIEVFEKNGGHHLVILHFEASHPTATKAIDAAISEGR